MGVVHVDWRWTVAFSDPACGAAFRVETPRSPEEALTLAQKLRRERCDLIRIAGPLGFRIPPNATGRGAKLGDDDARHAARIIPHLGEVAGYAGRQ